MRKNAYRDVSRLQHTPSMSVADSPDVHMNSYKYT